MESDSLVFKLVLLFKIISILGFLTTAAIIIGIFYKNFLRIFGCKAEKKRWVFIVISVFIIFVVMFMYLTLF